MAETHIVTFLHRAKNSTDRNNPHPLCTSSWPVHAVFNKGDRVEFHDDNTINAYRVTDVTHVSWSSKGFGGYKLVVTLESA